MKQSKGRIKNIETNTVNLDFGTYGLTVLESSRISAAQLEAVRRVLSRKNPKRPKRCFFVRGLSTYLLMSCLCMYM
jgi:ribosomal protein L16/L10AE